MAAYSSRHKRKKRENEMRLAASLGRNSIILEDSKDASRSKTLDEKHMDDPDYLSPLMIKNILMMDPRDRRKGTVEKLSKQFRNNKFLKEVSDTRD